MNLNWEDYRNQDGSINLVNVYTALYGEPYSSTVEHLSMIEFIQPIKSRQAAAIAVVSAKFFGEPK